MQSKYGTAFAGKETLLTEAQKAIDTLRGHNKRLSAISVVKVFSDIESESSNILRNSALAIIDDYLSPTLEDSIFHEESYKTTGDLNAFLKNDNLGKKDFTPLLVDAIKIGKRSLSSTGNAHVIENLLKDL